MKPTIGRIVLYKLSAYDAECINRRFQHARDCMDSHRANANGVVVGVGNNVSEGDVFPAIIVKVWGTDETSAVNLQAFLDGNITYWASSRCAGEGTGTWSWPTKV